MLKVTEKKDELILRDFPLYHLLVGATFTFMGVMLLDVTYDYVYRVMFGVLDFDFVVVMIVLLNTLAFIFGLTYILRAPMIVTTINRQTKSLSVETRSLLSREIRDFSFGEIESRLSVKTDSHKGRSWHTPHLKVLTTGEMIDLISSGLSRRGKAYDLVDLADRYLADESEKNNFRLTIFNDD